MDVPNMKGMETEIIRMLKVLDYQGLRFIYVFITSYLRHQSDRDTTKKEEQP